MRELRLLRFVKVKCVTNWSTLPGLQELTVDAEHPDALLRLAQFRHLRRINFNCEDQQGFSEGWTERVAACVQQLCKLLDLQRMQLHFNGFRVPADECRMPQLLRFVEHGRWNGGSLVGCEFNRAEADLVRSRMGQLTCSCEKQGRLLPAMLQFPLVDAFRLRLAVPQSTLDAMSSSWSGLRQLVFTVPSRAMAPTDGDGYDLSFLLRLPCLQKLRLKNVPSRDYEVLVQAVQRLHFLNQLLLVNLPTLQRCTGGRLLDAMARKAEASPQLNFQLTITGVMSTLPLPANLELLTSS